MFVRRTVLYSRALMAKKISLVPFVCGAGASTPGCEQGPVDLKRSGFAAFLQRRGLDVVWHGDPEALYAASGGAAHNMNLPGRGTAERRQIVLQHCTRLRDGVEAVLESGRFPVTIGGDHAMAMGSIAALARVRKAHGKIGVLWIDAHADIHTPETSASQALHGMPAAALLGWGDKDFAGLSGKQPSLKPEHIAYMGLRDVEPAEKEALEKHRIFYRTMTDIRKEGLENAFAAAMKRITKGTECLFLTLDLDAFDPAAAPSVGTPVPGGFTREELLPVLKNLAAKHDFAGIEITEYNPSLGRAEETRGLIYALAEALLATS